MPVKIKEFIVRLNIYIYSIYFVLILIINNI